MNTIDYFVMESYFHIFPTQDLGISKNLGVTVVIMFLSTLNLF